MPLKWYCASSLSTYILNPFRKTFYYCLCNWICNILFDIDLFALIFPYKYINFKDKLLHFIFIFAFRFGR